jgi:glycosyltransferase involved in cell wall biosynthesis
MKISVLIVAHNEAGNIARCLKSIQQQTLMPDEVILVAHNCSDKTVEIAKRFWSSQDDDKEQKWIPAFAGMTTGHAKDGTNWRVVEENGPSGIVYARIRGFKEVRGEIVACIDGDSVASKNWLQKLISRFDDRSFDYAQDDESKKSRSVVSAVGGGVWLTGGLASWLMSLDFFWLKPIYVPILKILKLIQDDGSRLLRRKLLAMTKVG